MIARESRFLVNRNQLMETLLSVISTATLQVETWAIMKYS